MTTPAEQRQRSITSPAYNPQAGAYRQIGHDEPPTITDVLRDILEELKNIRTLLEIQTGEEI